MDIVSKVRPGRTALVLGVALLMLVDQSRVLADSAEDINSRVAASLPMLYQNQPAAKTLAATANGILVFPNIVKAGFLVGAQYGDGTLLKKRHGRPLQLRAASYGFQAGVQSFAYAMFFMTDAALDYLDRSGGFEVGSARASSSLTRAWPGR